MVYKSKQLTFFCYQTMNCHVLLATVILWCMVNEGAGELFRCPDQHARNVPPSPESLPRLPEQFVMHVEANIMHEQTMSEAVEVYDFPNRRAAISVTSNNQTLTSIFNYATQERYDILANGSCRTLELRDSSFNVFRLTETAKSRHGTTILTAAEVFKFGEQVNKTFLGETTIRGIPVYHWQSCQSWLTEGMSHEVYVLDLFFSKPDYTTSTTTTTVPVRAILNGTATNVEANSTINPQNHNFYNIYDFSFFRPGPIQDDSIFEIPRGTVCKERKVTKPLPQLPDQFSLFMEVHAGGVNRPPVTERMLFDYDFGLIQTDRFAPRARGRQFGITHLTIIEDYQNHVQYIIDAFDGNCSIQQMPENLDTSGGGQGKQITMKHGQELLRYGEWHFVYQGQRWMRDMRVDVWANASDSGIVQEIYFLADWPSEQLRQKLAQLQLDINLSGMSLLVGTYLLNTSAIKKNLGPFFKLFGDQVLQPWGNQWSQEAQYSTVRLTNPRQQEVSVSNERPWSHSSRQGFWDSVLIEFPMASEKIINIFNYLPMHTDLSAFDIRPCFKDQNQEMYVCLTVDGIYSTAITSHRYTFMSSIKNAIAKAAGVSMLRVTNINIWQEAITSKLDIFFSLLEPPLPDAFQQISVKTAFDNLTAAIQKGMNITVKFPIQTITLQVARNSLRTWSSIGDLWGKMNSSKTHSSNDGTQAGQRQSSAGGSGYTPGQFGGMAFGMLLLGALFGAGVVYLTLHKLQPDIHLLTYQQSK